MDFAANCLPLTNRANRLFNKFDFGKTFLANITAESTARNTAFWKNKIKKWKHHQLLAFGY